ncbi:hypothetical protein CALCODRAFT_37146 [Calocera cornea HHB12733]|uniref:Zn(2)-C6 fungal-type domain-containing protein n=1 Tax=Calocera cornea HHB12733 TaxID=1353952 RepID=A0A165DZW0_9BASI|nr:hypothetical protein CALCODRAFT_37146 [Calocera cornea HHB12733]
MPAIRVKQQEQEQHILPSYSPVYQHNLPHPYPNLLHHIPHPFPADTTFPTMTITGIAEEKAKRKRQSQSCDACRARKVRCARDGAGPDEGPVPSTSNANGSAVANTPCKHCLALNIPCTYDYQPKKRGPPNLCASSSHAPIPEIDPSPSYLRRLQEQQQREQGQENGTQRGSVPPLSPTRSIIQSSTSTASHPPPPPPVPLTAWNATPSPDESLPLSLDMPPSRYPIAADTHTPSTSYAFEAPSSPTPSYTSAASISGRASLPPASGNYPPLPTPVGHHYMPLYPALDYHFTRQHRIDDIAPRPQILHILSLFFEFVYPLTPCVHKPSFLADLASRREERDTLFFALVMSTVASTLVQVPRACLPMSRREVRRLAQSCHEASRHITVAKYDPPMSIMVVIRYFDTVYHFCEGHDATSHASFGEAAHIAVTLHMHEESSYAACDPIETEVRRRVFWLLFDADKSMSVLLGRPICLRDEDCTLHFPKEVDDEYITLSGVQPQPPGKTAIISGLNYISRIFALLGEILVRIRVDKRSPPTGLAAQSRLSEIESLHSRIVSALAHTPPPLRLGRSSLDQHAFVDGSDSYPDAAFTKATYTELREFFDNPTARTTASDPFIVMQGNLYVTQQLVRFVIEQYRDELMMSMATAAGDTKATEELMAKQAQDQETVASDLLHVLHSIPIQAIATNGPSLVHKVRFVASTLLDTVRKVETDRASAARAHAYLWDFLSILSEIERNYL